MSGAEKKEGQVIDDSSDEEDVDYQPPEENDDEQEKKKKQTKSTKRPLRPALPSALPQSDDEHEDEDEDTPDGSTPTETDDTQADATDDGGVDDPESKRPRLEQRRQQSEAMKPLWAEMSAGLIADTPSVEMKQTACDNLFSEWLKPSVTEPLKPMAAVLPNLEELEAKQQEQEKVTLEVQRSAKSRSTKTGLERALSLVRGIGPDSLIDKTRTKWQDYKSDVVEVKDELEHHKKDKNRYTEKVAFLERSDVREWQFEQQGKKKRR